MLNAINVSMEVIARASAYLLNLHQPTLLPTLTAPTAQPTSPTATTNNNNTAGVKPQKPKLIHYWPSQDQTRADQTGPPPDYPFVATNHDFFIALDQDYPHMGLPQQQMIRPPSQLVLFNSLGFGREEVVCVFVPGVGTEQTQTLQVESPSEPSEAGGDKQWARVDMQQLQPVIEVKDGVLTMASDRQKVFLNSTFLNCTCLKPHITQLCFLATLPPMGFRRYRLAYTATAKGKGDQEVKVFYRGSVEVGTARATNINSKMATHLITLANEHVSVDIHPKTGYIQQWSSPLGSTPLKLDLSFVLYGEPAPLLSTLNK